MLSVTENAATYTFTMARLEFDYCQNKSQAAKQTKSEKKKKKKKKRRSKKHNGRSVIKNINNRIVKCMLTYW